MLKDAQRCSKMLELKKINWKSLAKSYQLSRNISMRDLRKLLRHTKRQSFAAREVIFEPGIKNYSVFLIVKGLVRAYAIDDKGNDITFVLRREGQFLGAPYTLIFDEPARLGMATLEATSIYSIDYRVLEKIVADSPSMMANQQMITQHLFKDSILRVESLLLLTPEERYLQFVRDNPQLINRVADKHIAHVLGITPVSLSRIRKRLSEKKS